MRRPKRFSYSPFRSLMSDSLSLMASLSEGLQALLLAPVVDHLGVVAVVVGRYIQQTPHEPALGKLGVRQPLGDLQQLRPAGLQFAAGLGRWEVAPQRHDRSVV